MQKTVDYRSERPLADPTLQVRVERGETCRMFESDFIERFSRINPVTPFVTYVPFILFYWYRAATRPGPAWWMDIAMVATGILIWSFVEYILHRYMFHWVGSSRAGRRTHFLLHGVHHEFPQDRDRLVMPIGFSIPFAVGFYFLFVSTFGPALGQIVWTGFAIGYLTYDGTHYAVHHFKLENRVFKWVRKHHMMHHHQDHSGGFGVSSPLWDLVFGTMPKPKGRPQSKTL